MNIIIYSFLSFFSLFHYLGAQPAIYTVDKGQVSFTSEAPLEIIKASSEQLRGAINMDENTFAFVVSTRSFEGFNSPLQKEHFNEKYLESDLYPNTTFTGKMIEKIDFSTPGEYKLRAKGTFTVHGVTQERIIRSTLIIEKKKMYITSSFSVLLADHNISIPKIVSQKIAEEIQVEIRVELEPKNN